MQLVTLVGAAALLSNTAFAVPQNLEKKSPVSSIALSSAVLLSHCSSSTGGNGATVIVTTTKLLQHPPKQQLPLPLLRLPQPLLLLEGRLRPLYKLEPQPLTVAQHGLRRLVLLLLPPTSVQLIQKLQR